MIEVNRIKKKMMELDVTVKDMAQVIGVDESTFYRKLKKNGSTFSVEQAQKIAEHLNLSESEACAIFFNQKLA